MRERRQSSGPYSTIVSETSYNLRDHQRSSCRSSIHHTSLLLIRSCGPVSNPITMVCAFRTIVTSISAVSACRHRWSADRAVITSIWIEQRWGCARVALSGESFDHGKVMRTDGGLWGDAVQERAKQLYLEAMTGVEVELTFLGI